MNTRTRGFVIIAGVCWIAAFSAPVAQDLKPFVPTAQVPGSLPAPVDVDRPSQPAVPTKEVPSPAAPSNAQEAVGWALGSVFILEYLKKKKWFTFLTDESTQRAKAIFGFVAAFLTAAGIQFAVSGSVLDAGGASVTLTGITFTGVKDVLFQWIAQEGWYRIAVQRPQNSVDVLPAGA